MSKLIVEVCKVSDIKEHPNADKLEILQIKGWDVVATKGSVAVGELVVFIPPDSVLSASLHTFLGITKYCAELPKHYGKSMKLLDVSLYDNPFDERPSARRVKAARLRGVPSYGTIMTKQSFVDYAIDQSLFPNVEDVREIYEYVEEGTDVSELLAVSKWEPPIKATQGDAERENSKFHKYTSIENWRNYPDVFKDDDIVICTEKIHGCLMKTSLITMYDGEKMYEKSICDIQPGEIVKTYDTKKGIFTTAKVKGVLVQDVTDQLDWFELELDNGRKLVCTEDHPILTTEGWVQAKDLTENHVIL